MFTILGYYKTPGFFGKFLMERKLHAIALRKTAILRYINVEISYFTILKVHDDFKTSFANEICSDCLGYWGPL